MKFFFVLLFIAFLLWFLNVNSETFTTKAITKKVLIITEDNNTDLPIAPEDFQLKTLLGHFETNVTILENSQYKTSNINKYDIVFYIGVRQESHPSTIFLNDVLTTKKTVVWINSGLLNNKKSHDFKKKFGFDVIQVDSSKSYCSVNSGSNIFNRGVGNLFITRISEKSIVNVIGTSLSIQLKREVPYIVKSGKLYYVADMPFLKDAEADRYLLFADFLHEIVDENHKESHNAIVRIEDVTPNRDPSKLRDIANILSERNVPFLVGLFLFFSIQ